jgi:hypothetical protein
MPGAVEEAVRARILPGARLPTPTGRAEFIVHELGRTGLVLLLGEEQAWTPFSWSCLEGVPGFLRGRGWVNVGANRDVNNDEPTLDGYLKRCIKRQTANYVAVVLERAEVVELDRQTPARVRSRWP